MIQRCTICGREFENHRKKVIHKGPGSRCVMCLLPQPPKPSATFGDFAEQIRRMIDNETALRHIASSKGLRFGPTRTLVDEPTCPELITFDKDKKDDDKKD